MPNFSIVIPNFNGATYLSDCLPSLIKSINNYPVTKFEIILVDNGSTDKSSNIFNKFRKIKNKNLKFKIIYLSKNYGFAKAVNIGIKQSLYDFTVVCNNDLTVNRDFFSQITQTIKKFPQAACYCPTVLNRQGTAIESQGISFDYAGKCIQNNHLLKIEDCQVKTHPVWGSSAALVVYQKNIIQKLGLFNEDYFAYLEDVDLAFRLHKNGYITILNPLAICYHLGGGTADRISTFRAFYTFRNWYIFIYRNYSLNQFIRYLPSITWQRLRNLSYLLKSYCGKNK